ncbi:hypothetical protein [Methylophaga sp.]|uniref:hypothetical protein n=1 Tax=Methylophaga sp. TaxID=2024840 RepID=UPI001400472F|nr:hypothetical protein [Methylophaga sp.]MTI64839.1 hypothetical protein [Methylophaga sp.]
MKRKVTHILLALFALQVPVIGYAHEKGNHASADNQKPNCETMQNMDRSKMDMNDPDMQAMMQKCMNHDMKGNHMDNESKADKSASETEKSSVSHKHKK